MKVKLDKDYKAAPEGHTTYPFKAGEEVEGKIAEMALRDGAASKPKKTKKPKVTKPEKPDLEQG